MRKKITFVLTAMLMLSVFKVGAVPARPGVTTYTQPDGTVLSVLRYGDERAHVFMTEDNYPLAAGQDGGLYYATIDADGLLQPSNILASNIARRQAPAKSFLSLMTNDVDVSTLLKARKAHSKRLPQSGMGRVTSSYPTTGKVRGLVVLVNYSDVQFTMDDPKTYFTNMLNQKGFSEYNATGSALDYFTDSSTGQFEPEFDVYGPITLPENRAYYGENDRWGNDAEAHMMAVHAAEILDDEIDFNVYDVDNNGVIDNMYIFYAGEGESGYGPANSVWPHSWDLHDATSTAYMYDGVRLDHYACSNEIDNGTPDGVGTFVHEFSHVLGLPDLYNTESSSEYTPYYWDILDVGCYLNNSRTPPAYSAYERNAMQWLEPELIDSRASITLQPITDSNRAYIIQTSNEREYFLFENRQQKGWDSYIPGHGMLIWHIDATQDVYDNNTVNNIKNRQYVDIVEANNNPTGKATSMAGYPWPGTSNKTSFTQTTTPAFKEWSGDAINLPITNIKETNQLITFDVKGGWFELTAPTNITVSNIISSGFTVTWDAVDRATSYTISVYTKGSNGRRNYVSGLEGLALGDVTSYSVAHLQPETQYYFTLMATDEEIQSPASAEQSVTTGPFVFTQSSVTALSAENVDDNGFDARWEELSEAVSYNLTVNAINEGATQQYDVDFGEGTEITIPDDWYFTGSTSSPYVTTSNCGQSTPALKMSKDGVLLLSPDFGAQIVSISFWCRGVNTQSSGSNIEVQVYVNEAWKTVSTVVLSGTAETITVEDIPTGAQTVRFVYNKQNGNAALDDICIKCSQQTVETLNGYDNLEVGNVTSYHVTGLINGITKYSYMVTAKNAAGESSLASEEIKVEVSGNSAISDVKVDTAGEVEYYNLQGLRVNPNNLTHGIYIRRQGSSVKKVIL